jgi:phosphatidylglycerol:prolipoprotein diacylglycerol transferase
VQGFNAATAVAGTIAVVVAGFPAGPLLDASAPGLFFGLAVGRIGCFFAGCCCGRPTRSRWGVWSSDQRIGMRRVPTQLLESALSLLIGLLALAAVVGGVPLHGGIFVAALAAYTLFRQGILRLRTERPPGSGRGARLTVAAALVVLILGVGHLATVLAWYPSAT